MEENSTPTSELTALKKKQFTPQGYVANMMEISNIPESSVTSNNNPSTFLFESLVTDTLKINKEIRSAGLSLYKIEKTRTVCFFWKHLNNGLYLSYPIRSTRTQQQVIKN